MKGAIVRIEEVESVACQSGVLLVVTDYHTRRPLHSECIDAASCSPAQALVRVFTDHGFPKTVITDNSISFTSKEFSAFLAEYGCFHTLLSPWTGAGTMSRNRQERV